MHRFTRLTQQLTCLTSISTRRAAHGLPLQASLIRNRPSLCRSFVAWQPLRTKQDTIDSANAKISATTEETEEDDLEEIDPKLYEELTTDENGETIDTDWFVEEEDFVPLWQRRAVEGHLQERQASLQELVETGAFTVDTVKQLLEESKMDDVQVLDIRDKCDWTDYMVVASSERGERFLSNVAENIAQAMRKAARTHPDKRFPQPRMEGRDDATGWLLMDLGRCVVHLFTPEMREKYDLESLWTKDTAGWFADEAETETETETETEKRP
ncbi:Oligomerization domain-domain-containing protein [Syncephalastrum racemosum]|uniref:Oligomerization domain-domain-containing protein n=1 Tax=Syncephalastrum racemosum TaxID=13706 RepID=A0A1X2HNJ5_SYNRA|nr:Oligomerization domain-domain-containing protein [Syncephalastrum racemosum]